MPLTSEQQHIIEVIQQPDCDMLLVDSVAGSGKSFTALESSSLEQFNNILYTAYNAKVVADGKRKFDPRTTQCSTMHSIAYQNTVNQLGLTVGYFNPRDISERLPYETKLLITEHVKYFCLSKYLKVDDYFANRNDDTDEIIQSLVRKYLKQMRAKEIPTTHDFYLKLFHQKLANKSIVFDEFDLIIVDEFGDIFPATLEIFKLLPAKKKLALGDVSQALYAFNGCVNGFLELNDYPNTKTVKLTESFRVATPIANDIEEFMQEYINPAISFIGQDHSTSTIKTKGFVTKTNVELIGKMIEYNQCRTKYNLLRPVKSIFELPLILMSLHKGQQIKPPEWRHLADDYREHKRLSEIPSFSQSFTSFLSEKYPFDIQLQSVFRLFRDHSYGDV
ncbi:MAG: UvrD-helicase domain-containing protein, partial [Euryarchaeota archaeon]|nr:UvrD-helicase domain-containing protein [Euryarchaeota archaeon]